MISSSFKYVHNCDNTHMLRLYNGGNCEKQSFEKPGCSTKCSNSSLSSYFTIKRFTKFAIPGVFTCCAAGGNDDRWSSTVSFDSRKTADMMLVAARPRLPFFSRYLISIFLIISLLPLCFRSPSPWYHRVISSQHEFWSNLHVDLYCTYSVQY